MWKENNFGHHLSKLGVAQFNQEAVEGTVTEIMMRSGRRTCFNYIHRHTYPFFEVGMTIIFMHNIRDEVLVRRRNFLGVIIEFLFFVAEEV